MVKKCLIFTFFIALLGWMVWTAGPAQLWSHLIAWNWVLVACIAVWAVGYLLNAASFRLVIGCFMANDPASANHRTIGFRRLMSLTIGGYALNYVTPFGLLGGEPWRIYRLRRLLPAADANSAVVYYAMMHVCSHVIFWLIGLVYAFFALRGVLAVLLADVTDVVILVTVIALVLLAIVIAFRVAVRKGWIRDLRTLLANHPKQFVGALALELASRMVNVAEFWLLLGVAFPGSEVAGYGAAYLVVAFSSLFANALFFSPMQLGTREGGILLILQALLPAMTAGELLPWAISISLATRIREFFWIGAGLLMIAIGQKQEKDNK